MPSTTNRWLDANTGAPKNSVPAAVPPTILPSGPTKPQLSVPQPDHADRLPRRDVGNTTAHYWWLGVHGGAGETSLARLDRHTRAAGHHWPVTATGSTVVLVARSNMSGLLAAQRAATEWASGTLPGIRLAGLVVMADAPGRLPKEIRDFARVVGGGVPHLWTIPWIPEWRLGHELTLEQLPTEARTVLAQVRAAATSTTAGHPVN